MKNSTIPVVLLIILVAAGAYYYYEHTRTSTVELPGGHSVSVTTHDE